MADYERLVQLSPPSDLESLVAVTLEGYEAELREGFENGEEPIGPTAALIELAATAIFWTLGFDYRDDEFEQIFTLVKSRAQAIVERMKAAKWEPVEDRPGRLH